MLFSCTARSWPHSMEKLKNKTVLADLAPLECIPRRISSSSLASFGAYAPPKPSWGESIVPRWQNIRWNLIFYVVHEILKKQNICLWSHCPLCICRCFLASFEPLVIFGRAKPVICMWLHWSHIVLFCEANFIIRLLFPVDSTSCCVVCTCWSFGYNCFLLILDGTRPSECILSIMSQVNNQIENPSVVILPIHYTGIVAANTWPSWPLKQTKRPARGGGLCKTKLAIENKKHGL